MAETSTTTPSFTRRCGGPRRSWFCKKGLGCRIEPDERPEKILPFTSFVYSTETESALRRKIFGSSRNQSTVLDDEEEEAEERRVPFSPLSPWRQQWELLVVLSLVYTCFVMPPRVAFGNDTLGPFFVIDALLDGLFLLDVFVSFQTGFLENGILEMSPRAVRHRYLQTTCFMDILSSLPTELTYYLITQYVRLPRLGRFLRLPRLLDYISRWQDQLTLNSNALRIFKLAFLISVFAHLNACLQFLVAEIEGFPTEGWVVTGGLQNAPVSVQYSHSLFKSLSHMLCIGYGQTPPVTLAEIWVTIISMVVGASFYIVLFGIMSALMLSLDRSGAMYEERMDSWQEYFRFCRMPKSLRGRITDYLKHKYDTHKMFDENSLLEGLPPSLRTDLQMFLCEELISHVPIFKACRHVVVRALVSNMVREAFSPGDYIFFSGEPADNLYFILNGMIQIETDDGSVLTSLSTGSYFGEFALLAYYRGDRTTHRMANARSVTYCDIYALSCCSFKQLADRFPEVVTLFEATAEFRCRANQAKQENVQETSSP